MTEITKNAKMAETASLSLNASDLKPLNKAIEDVDVMRICMDYSRKFYEMVDANNVEGIINLCAENGGPPEVFLIDPWGDFVLCLRKGHVKMAEWIKKEACINVEELDLLYCYQSMPNESKTYLQSVGYVPPN